MPRVFTNRNGPRKKHGALICRIIPKKSPIEGEGSGEAEVEILLQKHSSGRNDPDPYGFVSFLEAPNMPAPDIETTKYILRKNFGLQCGAQVPWASTPEAPPLIPVGHLDSRGTHFIIFVIPRSFNSWTPKPSSQFPFLKYSNEAISINSSPYSVHSGHVWVNFTSFVAECGNQFALNYKDTIACRFGVNCRNIDTCSFLHVNESQIPQAVPNSMIVEKEIVQFILSSSGLIGNLVVERLNKYYKDRTLYCSANEPFNISQDPHLEAEIALAYEESQFCLKLKNKTTVQMEISLATISCPNASSIIAEFTNFQANNSVAVQKGESIEVLGKYEARGFFGLEELPYIDIYYKTTDLANRMRVKLPIFMYKYCAPIPNFDPSGNPDTVRDFVLGAYRTPLLINEKNFTLKMGAANSFDKNSWAQSLRTAGIMVCTPFKEGDLDYYCVVSSLQSQGIVIIMNFFVKPNDQNCFLNVLAKFAEPKLYYSFVEVICCLSSTMPGFESSLLDPPPYTNQ